MSTRVNTAAEHVLATIQDAKATECEITRLSQVFFISAHTNSNIIKKLPILLTYLSNDAQQQIRKHAPRRYAANVIIYAHIRAYFAVMVNSYLQTWNIQAKVRDMLVLANEMIESDQFWVEMLWFVKRWRIAEDNTHKRTYLTALRHAITFDVVLKTEQPTLGLFQGDDIVANGKLLDDIPDSPLMQEMVDLKDKDREHHIDKLSYKVDEVLSFSCAPFFGKHVTGSATNSKVRPSDAINAPLFRKKSFRGYLSRTSILASPSANFMLLRRA